MRRTAKQQYERADADLIEDRKLPTTLSDNVVRHTYYRFNQPVCEEWHPVRKISGHSNASVWLQQGRSDGRLRAVKILNKLRRTPWQNEIGALAKFSKHQPHFVEFYGWYDDAQSSLYLAMEYCALGDLASLKQSTLPEQEVCLISRQLLQGLEVMHGMGFLHRDLKPNNILIVSPAPHWKVKIADFGSAIRIRTGHSLVWDTGWTLGFQAPECLGLIEDDDDYYTDCLTVAVDLWSLGCIIYLLLSGEMPFGDDKIGLLKSYCSGRRPLPLELLNQTGTPGAAIDVIQILLSKRPSDRSSAGAALDAPWFNSNCVAALDAEDARVRAVEPSQKLLNLAHPVTSAPETRLRRATNSNSFPGIYGTTTKALELKPIERSGEENAQLPEVSTQNNSLIPTIMIKTSAESWFYFSMMAYYGHRPEQQWNRQREIGAGTFGVVFLEQERDTESLRVVKEIRKSRALLHLMEREKTLLEMISKSASQAYFVQVHAWFENDTCFSLIMEYFELGDLGDYLGNAFREHDVRTIANQLLLGLDFLHENGFAHRDIKPFNIFVTQNKTPWMVKIGDTGTVGHFTADDWLLTTMIGTMHYLAPEVTLLLDDQPDAFSSYTSACDLWSLGILLYQLITAALPFRRPADLKRYCDRRLDFPRGLLQSVGISAHGIAFVQKLLAPSPTDRPTAKVALRDAWLSRECELSTLRQATLALDPIDSNFGPRRVIKNYDTLERRETPLVANKRAISYDSAFSYRIKEGNFSQTGTRTGTDLTSPVTIATSTQAQSFSEESPQLSKTTSSSALHTVPQQRHEISFGEVEDIDGNSEAEDALERDISTLYNLAARLMRSQKSRRKKTDMAETASYHQGT